MYIFRIKFVYLICYIYTVFVLNRFDTFIDRLDELKNLTEEEIAETHPGMSKENYDKALKFSHIIIY